MHQPVRAATILSATIALAALAAGPAAACTHGGGSSGGYGSHASAGGHGGSGAGDHHGSYGDQGSSDHHGSYGDSGPSRHDTPGYGGTDHTSYQQGDQTGDQHSHCHKGVPAPSTGGSHPTGVSHHTSGPSSPTPAAPPAPGAAPAPTHVTTVPAAVTLTKTFGSSHAAPAHGGGGLWGTSPTMSGQTAATVAHAAPARAEKVAQTLAGKHSGGAAVPGASASTPTGTSVAAAPAAVPTSIDAGKSGSFLSRLAHSPLDLGLVLLGMLLGAAGLVVRLSRTAA